MGFVLRSVGGTYRLLAKEAIALILLGFAPTTKATTTTEQRLNSCPAKSTGVCQPAAATVSNAAAFQIPRSNDGVLSFPDSARRCHRGRTPLAGYVQLDHIEGIPIDVLQNRRLILDPP